MKPSCHTSFVVADGCRVISATRSAINGSCLALKCSMSRYSSACCNPLPPCGRGVDVSMWMHAGCHDALRQLVRGLPEGSDWDADSDA